MSLPMITGIGRTVDDVELRFTPNGKAVAKVRIAFSDRKKDDSGNWVDGDKAFLDASVWGDEAEHLAEGLTRGTEVLVQGKLRQREYDARDGSKRVVFELLFATIAPTSRYATVKVQRMERSGGQRQQQRGDDPWATQSAQPDRGFGGRPQPVDDSPPF